MSAEDNNTDNSNSTGGSPAGGSHAGGSPPSPRANKKSMGAAAKSFYTDPATRKMALITTGVAVVAILFGGYRILSGPPTPEAVNDTVSKTQLRNAPGGNKGSEEYNKQLNHANHVMGQKAALAGKTYLPTPTGLHPQPKPMPASKPVAPTVSAPATVVVSNPYTPQQPIAPATAGKEVTAMQGELTRFDTNAPYPIAHITGISMSQSSGGASNNNAANASMQANSTVLSHPGYLTFAMLDSAVNSNIPGPILATIESGKFKTARLLGGFKRVKQVDILQFSEMTWKGHSYPIHAFAVSPKNAQVALATSVNNHVLYRYGWLFAGAFLQGVDQAMMSANQSLVMGPGYAVLSHSLNNGQILTQAAGNVGNVMTPIAERRFYTPPTVRVAAGTGMGILFMSPVKSKS